MIPDEANYLLIPLHRSFHRIRIGVPRELITDMRLIERRIRG
jgi:hypothetical protein